EAFKVGIDINMGMADRMADAGLPRHVDHVREFLACEQRRYRRAIREICMHEFEARRPPQQIEPRPLERGIVEVVEIIHSDDVAALGKQLLRDMKTDETRGTRDQYGLFRHHIPDSAGSALPAPAGPV